MDGDFVMRFGVRFDARLWSRVFRALPCDVGKIAGQEMLAAVIDLN